MQGVTLNNIGGGALSELFEAELVRVLENIADPNTDAGARRSINISVSFKPKADRSVADVTLTCGSKVAGIKNVDTQLYMGKHQGKLIAVENDPRQSSLFDQPKPTLAAVAQFPQTQKDGE